MTDRCSTEFIYNNRRHRSVTGLRGARRDRPPPPPPPASTPTLPEMVGSPCFLSGRPCPTDVNTWCCYLLAEQSRQQRNMEPAKKNPQKPILLVLNTDKCQIKGLLPPKNNNHYHPPNLQIQTCGCIFIRCHIKLGSAQVHKQLPASKTGAQPICNC